MRQRGASTLACRVHTLVNAWETSAGVPTLHAESVRHGGTSTVPLKQSCLRREVASCGASTLACRVHTFVNAWETSAGVPTLHAESVRYKAYA
jgi:hypothetical protein